MSAIRDRSFLLEAKWLVPCYYYLDRRNSLWFLLCKTVIRLGVKPMTIDKTILDRLEALGDLDEIEAQLKRIAKAKEAIGEFGDFDELEEQLWRIVRTAEEAKVAAKEARSNEWK